jgi:hypothetical protein
MDNCEMILARKEGGIFLDAAIWLVAALWAGSSFAKYSIALNA